jgi:hypothetical protein
MKQKYMLLWIALIFFAIYMFVQSEHFSTGGNILVAVLAGFFIFIFILPMLGVLFVSSYRTV